MKHFPVREIDEPITREHLSIELAVIRQEFGELRLEMHREFGSVRTEMQREFGSVRAATAELRTEMHRELRLMFAALVAVMGVLCGIATTVVTVWA